MVGFIPNATLESTNFLHFSRSVFDCHEDSDVEHHHAHRWNVEVEDGRDNLERHIGCELSLTYVSLEIVQISG